MWNAVDAMREMRNEKGPLVLKTGESLITGGRVVLGASEDGSPIVKVWVGSVVGSSK